MLFQPRPTLSLQPIIRMKLCDRRWSPCASASWTATSGKVYLLVLLSTSHKMKLNAAFRRTQTAVSGWVGRSWQTGGQHRQWFGEDQWAESRDEPRDLRQVELTSWEVELYKKSSFCCPSLHMPLQSVTEEVAIYLAASLKDCRGERYFLLAILSLGTEILSDHTQDPPLSSASRSSMGRVSYFDLSIHVAFYMGW